MIEAIAFEAFRSLLVLYDRKYGKYGEAACRKLKHDLAEMELRAHFAGEEIEELHHELEMAHELLSRSHKVIADLREKYNRQVAIIAARDGGVQELDSDPYADSDNPSPTRKEP